jgi:hypothetical protein
MRSQTDLTGLIKFLGRDGWKSSFEEVLSEHFGPALHGQQPAARPKSCSEQHAYCDRFCENIKGTTGSVSVSV